MFRELNLLALTVFVLSRFDEVADIEDDWDYRESLNTKKQNVSNRLKEMISLSETELNNLKIVAIAANPYGEGVGHWLQNLEEFKKISRIQTLQDATRKTIEENGGSTPIVLEAQKSMIQDVLKKQMPLVRERQAHLNHELLKLSDTALHLNNDLEPLESKITRVRIDLKDFVLNHFTSLIRKVQGSDLNTFSDFYENELGNDGIQPSCFPNCNLHQPLARLVGLDIFPKHLHGTGEGTERISNFMCHPRRHFPKAGKPFLAPHFLF